MIEPVEKQMIDPVEKMIVHLTGKRSSQLSRKDKAIKFPVKLMYALECGCYEDIISWSPSGLALIIMDPKRFEKEVLPDLFKEAKFSSFDRKIKRWGFVKAKVNRGTRSCCYGHPKFQKGNYRLCMAISCSANQQSHVFGSYHDSTTRTMPAPNAVGMGHSPTSLLSFNSPEANGARSLRIDDPIHIAHFTRNSTQSDSLKLMGRSSYSYPASSSNLLYEPGATSSTVHVGLRCNPFEVINHQHSYVNGQPSSERSMAFAMKLLRQDHQETGRSILWMRDDFISTTTAGQQGKIFSTDTSWNLMDQGNVNIQEQEKGC